MASTPAALVRLEGEMGMTWPKSGADDLAVIKGNYVLRMTDARLSSAAAQLAVGFKAFEKNLGKL